MWYIFFFFRVTEFADHLHEHFIHPCVVENGAYKVPIVSFQFGFLLTNMELKQQNSNNSSNNCIFFSSQNPGYNAEMKTESLDAFEFPSGSEWQKLIKNGLFKI